MSKFAVGDQVELREDVEPHYSGYAGNPDVVVKAGTVGTVEAVDVPKVRHPGTFICVDFLLPGVFQGNPKYNACIWRCPVSSKQIKKVK